MSIKLVSKVSVDQKRLDAARKKLEEIEGELVVYLKTAISSMVDLDNLYALRDFIDDHIGNWDDEEVELDDDFLDDDEN